MDEIIENESNQITSANNNESALIEISKGLLLDARTSMKTKNVLSVPIAELSALGSGISSVVPALNTVTQSTTIAADGIYRLANASVGDTLKVAKNGNFWGAFKTAEGASKFAQLQEAGPITATTQTIAAFNPATMLMAASLFSIEQELGKIEEMQKQILSFLEVEKESEIEADIEMLMDIVHNYKMNWNNEHYVTSNHKMVRDIQRNARKNILVYQKNVRRTIEKKQLIVAQNNIKQAYAVLEKKFKYYRLSLYTFSLASMMEIMLSGNFNEEYISGVKQELLDMSQVYRDLFAKSSMYLEKLGSSAIGTNVLKGVGNAGNAVGKLIGSIPLIKEGPVDELLQDSGTKLKKSMIDVEHKSVHNFATLNNPETSVFINKMNDLIQIYNHTEHLCFDADKIYLVTD